MKVAASDYDGTLLRGGVIDEETKAGIARWRAAGHKFGVVSGRDYGMLVPQLRKYGVEFDYTVCNNGGIIRGTDETVRFQAEITPRALTAIAEETTAQKSFHFAFSAADVTYLCHHSEGSWIEREAKDWDFPIVYIEESEIGGLTGIQQFSLGFPEPALSDACAAVLNAKLGDAIHAFPNACSLDITPAGISKDQGIRTLLSVMGWDGAEIYAIGDETNDLPMLKAFDGYSLTSARKEIQSQAKEVFPSVGAMLDHFR
ncbi:HAD family hydrolase [Selenomonas sp. TAMA-11512]|uniref:HAD family hydrolase n=1 Tax=Selenomonas sp. TAMA-11512 TaxID=3095337 RepID=UPI00308C8066|nr:HAD family hydrolase [Selenomonas sp. TAMA-11512]